MVRRGEVLEAIADCGLIAVIRLAESNKLSKVAEAIQTGGVNLIEFTMTTPNALDVLSEVTRTVGKGVIFGAGTVLDAETARAAILAGAEFLVSPTLNRGLIEMAHRYDKVVIPGAFTPTEILAAWEMGADLVKIFPASVGGPGYCKAVRGPLPQIRLVPTGGVSLDNAADFIKAGATALAVGGNLVSKKAIAEDRFDVLAETASKFTEVVRKAREELRDLSR